MLAAVASTCDTQVPSHLRWVLWGRSKNSPKRANLWGPPRELIWLTASCFGRLRGETKPQSALINTILVPLIFRSRRGKGNSWLSQFLLGERENSRLASRPWGLLPEGLSACHIQPLVGLKIGQHLEDTGILINVVSHR